MLRPTKLAPRTIVRSLPAICIALVLSVLPARTAKAWACKEHILMTRLAAERLLNDPKTPPAMKEWLRCGHPHPMTMAEQREWALKVHIGIQPQGAEGLAYWAVVPDLVRDQGAGQNVEPFPVGERQLHFTDLEHFNPDAAKHFYKDDLSHKPKLEDFPDNMTDPRWPAAGMLPLRVRQVYGMLVTDFKAGKLIAPPDQPKDDDHAVRWAGYLAHYLEDNTQPQHATADYKSASYFGKGAARGPNVHGDVEYRLLDDEHNDYPELRKEFWDLFAKALNEFPDPVADEQDLFKATLQISLKSYDALPIIGRAAMAAYHQAGTPTAPQGLPGRDFDANAFFQYKGTFDGQEMTILQLKARQMAWAVKRVQALWLRAWNDSHP